MTRAGVLWVCVVASAVAFAGCVDGSPSDGDSPPPSTGSGTPAPDPSPTGDPKTPDGGTPTDTGYPRQAHWTDCEGMTSVFNWPLGATHAPHAPGWEPVGPRVATEIELYGLECQRFSMGPFERPIRMIMETHDYQEAPQGCYPEDPAPGLTEFQTLNTIWFNDQEVVDYVDAVLGMPVHYANITIEEEPVAEGTKWWQWSWGIEGQETSWLRGFDDQERDIMETHEFRIFWYNDTAVSAMDYTSHENNPGWVQNIFAYGQMQPPMLMADWPTDYGGVTNTLLEARADATITKYNDFVCTEPIE